MNSLPGPDPRNLIVNYIPTPVTDEDLRKLFERFGEIETARVIVDKNNNHPKGYGFVKFVDKECARTAMEAMNGFEVHNKRLKVTQAKGPTASLASAPAPISHGNAHNTHSNNNTNNMNTHNNINSTNHNIAVSNSAIDMHMMAQAMKYEMMQRQIQAASMMQMNPMMYMNQMGMAGMPMGAMGMPMMGGMPMNPMGMGLNMGVGPMPMMGGVGSMGMPQMGMGGLGPLGMGVGIQPGFSSMGTIVPELPSFPQQMTNNLNHDQGANSRMTLMGVSGLGSANCSPSGSMDGKQQQ